MGILFLEQLGYILFVITRPFYAYGVFLLEYQYDVQLITYQFTYLYYQAAVPRLHSYINASD